MLSNITSMLILALNNVTQWFIQIFNAVPGLLLFVLGTVLLLSFFRLVIFPALQGSRLSDTAKKSKSKGDNNV